MRTVKVPLAERSYPIRIGSELLAELGKRCAQLRLGKRCAVISDANVSRRYRKRTLDSLKNAGFEPMFISQPAGERSKTLKNVQACYDQLARHRFERGSFVIALGGGVGGDMGGFVAATYLRGIDLVQVPTTLLAQVDSSVGGKVGVNLRAGKNLVGAFYQPKLVLCDLDTLRTLPSREFRAGLAEVIKYGIIYDAKLFARLERELSKLLNYDPTTTTAVIARCCQIKAAVVGQDEKEAGLRAILNFGHTIGHALETYFGFETIRHGEAIAYGMIAAGKLSIEYSKLKKHSFDSLRNTIQKLPLPQLPEYDSDKILKIIQNDKKIQ